MRRLICAALLLGLGGCVHRAELEAVELRLSLLEARLAEAEARLATCEPPTEAQADAPPPVQ